MLGNYVASLSMPQDVVQVTVVACATSELLVVKNGHREDTCNNDVGPKVHNRSIHSKFKR